MSSLKERFVRACEDDSIKDEAIKLRLYGYNLIIMIIIINFIIIIIRL